MLTFAVKYTKFFKGITRITQNKHDNTVMLLKVEITGVYQYLPPSLQVRLSSMSCWISRQSLLKNVDIHEAAFSPQSTAEILEYQKSTEWNSWTVLHLLLKFYENWTGSTIKEKCWCQIIRQSYPLTNRSRPKGHTSFHNDQEKKRKETVEFAQCNSILCR